jgi:hypothetical protein
MPLQYQSGFAKWDGNTWFDVGGGVNGIVRAISVVGNDVYVGGVFTMAGGSISGRIARWDGSEWHALGDGVDGSVFSMKQSENDLYVGGLFTNAGNQPANHIAKFNMIDMTWSPLGEGATGSVDAMSVQGTTGSMVITGAFSYVGNNIPANYVARFTDNGNPLPVEIEVTLPAEFVLEQNYPNPFNPTTTIKYSLPSAGEITLTIFDLSGSEVATLVNQSQPAGNYIIEFDASHLSSGIYYYQLNAGNFSQTKKLILLK